MGYSVRLVGEVVIYPPLPLTFVEFFNKIACARNNTFGDGDPLSFDSCIHKMSGGCELMGLYHSPNTKVPSCYCYWFLYSHHSAPKPYTVLESYVTLAENPAFINYEFWLQYVIDYIDAQFVDKQLSFSGSIQWNGEAIEDSGMLSLQKRWKPAFGGAHGCSRWEVLVQPSTKKPLYAKRLRMMTPSIKNFFDLRPSLLRKVDVGGYVIIAQKRNDSVVGILEPKESAILHSDPFKQSECIVPNTQKDQWKKNDPPSLVNICCNIIAKYSMVASAIDHLDKLILVIDMKEKLMKEGRFCSGCSTLFYGPAGAFVTYVYPHSGDYILYYGRYCTVSCCNRYDTFPVGQFDGIWYGGCGL